MRFSIFHAPVIKFDRQFLLAEKYEPRGLSIGLNFTSKPPSTLRFILNSTVGIFHFPIYNFCVLQVEICSLWVIMLHLKVDMKNACFYNVQILQVIFMQTVTSRCYLQRH